MLSKNAVPAPKKRRVPAWLMWTGLALAAGAGVFRGGAGGRSYSAGFSEDEATLLFDRSSGATRVAQELYHALKGGSEGVRVPASVTASRGSFARVLLHEGGENLTEGDLWRAPAAVLYEFMETARKGFPMSPFGGIEAPLEALAKPHFENAVRCSMTVERLQRLSSAGAPLPGGGEAAKSAAAARKGETLEKPAGVDLAAAFEGRGSALIAAYAKGCLAADFASRAASADDKAGYHDAVMAGAKALADAREALGR